MLSKPNLLFSILLVALCVQAVINVKLEKGNILIKIIEQNKDTLQHKVNINSKLPSTLELTQNSRIKIEANFEFSSQKFKPQFVSFRLKHAIHQNLTEPVLSRYESQNNEYHAFIDLGDPKHIKPFSDKYQLEIILADESLEKNVRNIIAECNVVFRKSWVSIPSSDLHYRTESIIETSAPAKREDPPTSFTIFVVLLILAIDGIFIFGLKNLNVNFSLFPKSAMAYLKNVGFLVILGANWFFLFQFWLNWTFLTTLHYFFWLLLVTAVVSNLALKQLKKN